jgi:hypothetical protein
MIILDEQLLSYGVQASIARWYRGTVTDITRLRPNTVIFDEAIPMLLRTAPRPMFVTINVADFWRRLAPDPRFCIVCCAVPHTRAQEVPTLLRRVLALEQFRTHSHRLGKIVRVSRQYVQYYTTDVPTIQRIAWPKAPRLGQKPGPAPTYRQ